MDPRIRPEPQPLKRTAPLPLPVRRSEDILDGQREVLIQHGDTWYRLRHTSNGKLILTK